MEGVDQALAGGFVGGVGDCAGFGFGAGGEEFFFLELEAFPRRVAEDYVEAAVVVDVGEFEGPVEVGVLLGGLGGCADEVAAGAAGEGVVDVGGGGDLVRLVFGGCVERGEEGVGPEVAGGLLSPPVGALSAGGVVAALDLADVFGAALGLFAEGGEFGCEAGGFGGCEFEGELAFAFFAVLLLVGVGGRLLVAGYGVVRAVGDALFEGVEVEDAD